MAWSAQLLPIITEAAMADPQRFVSAERGSRGPSYHFKYRREPGPIKAQQFSGALPLVYIADMSNCHCVALLLTLDATD
jgi:hypothetical protein